MACLGRIWDDIMYTWSSSRGAPYLFLAERAFIFVDLNFLGMLGKGHLAAGYLAMTYMSFLEMIIEGGLCIMDLKIQDALERHNRALARYWTYVAMGATFLLWLFSACIMLLSPLILRATAGSNSHTIAKAFQYIMLSIPALGLQSAARIMQKFEFAIGGSMQVVRSPIIILVIGIIANTIGNYFFMNLFGWGFVGCMVSTFLARCLVVLLQFSHFVKKSGVRRELRELLRIVNSVIGRLVVRYIGINITKFTTTQSALHRDQHVDGNGSDSDSEFSDGNDSDEGEESLLFVEASSSALFEDVELRTTSSPGLYTHGKEGERKNVLESDETQTRTVQIMSDDDRLWEYIAYCSRYLSLGIFGGILLLIDMAWLDTAAFFVSYFGNVALCSYGVVVYTMRTLYFIATLPLANAITSRIHKMLGSESGVNILDIKTYARVSFTAGVVIAGISGGFLYLVGPYIGFLFTRDFDVISRIGNFSTLAAVTLTSQCLCGFLQGLLRGAGRHIECMRASIITVWILGITTAYYLCYKTRPRFGLSGFWIGLGLGCLLMVFTLLVAYFFLSWEAEARRMKLFNLRRIHDEDDIIITALPTTLSVGSIPLPLLLRYEDEERIIEEIEYVEYDESGPRYASVIQNDGYRSDDD
jgi:Na+-driven multidrug efflux pump